MEVDKENESGVPDNAPVLHPIVPELGYVKGNVVVISARAQRVLDGTATDVTAKEREMAAAWLKKLKQ
jgi:hypothetical protein